MKHFLDKISYYFFDKQMHVLILGKKQIARDKGILYHIHWLTSMFKKVHLPLVKNSVYIRDKAVLYQSHQMTFSISTFILLYWKADCTRWNSSLATPSTIYFDKRRRFPTSRDNSSSFINISFSRNVIMLAFVF